MPSPWEALGQGANWTSGTSGHLDILMDKPGGLARLLVSSSQKVAPTSLYHGYLELVGSQGSTEGQGEHC